MCVRSGVNADVCVLGLACYRILFRKGEDRVGGGERINDQCVLDP